MKMNRLLIGIICASMAVAQLPVNVFAETADFDEGSEAAAVEEEQDEFEEAQDAVSDAEDSLLADPSYTLNGYDYYYDSKTKTLTVEGDGEYPGQLFYNDYVASISSNLDKIIFKSTGALSAYQLFTRLENVKEIDLSGFDTSHVTDMGEMFSGCKSLKTINLTGVNTSNVTNMNEMFWNCHALDTIDVTGFDTSKVTGMAYMFANCYALKSLNISGFVTSNVTRMDNMFQGCKSLTALDLRGLNTSKVTDMSTMFYGCENLTSLNISELNTGNVTNMLGMFEDCKKVSALSLEEFDTKNVKNMKWMLSGCEALESIDLTGLNVSNLEEMDGMFSVCGSLKTLDLSTWNLSKAKSTKKIVNGCYNLQTFKTPYNNMDEYTLPVTMVDQNGKTYYKDRTPIMTTTSLTLTASGKQDGPDEPDDENYDHKLTLSNSSDYNSVHIYAYNGNNVVHHKDVKKGETFGFNNGNHLVITGLGLGTGMDKTPFTYFVKVAYADEEKYCDGYSHDRAICDLEYPTNDLDILVQGRHLPVGAITAKGRVAGDYTITTTIASKKGNYIGIPKNGTPVKVTFAAKKTGSLNYEIANPTATIRYGAGNPEDIALSEEKNKYYYEVPFDDLARLAYSETPSVEFTVNAAAKLPAPIARVSASTDIDATLSLDVPKAAKNLPKLWYRIEGTANVPKNKTLPEGMAKFVGPLYVPASVTELTVDLTAKEGMKPGDGAAQKYDFEVSLLQLENEPVYTDKPLTDRTAVEGALGENVIGVSNEKKVSGSTKKPGYEEKLGLNKKTVNFIRGEGGDDGILLATAKYSKNTTFRSLSYAKITNASGEIVKSSDTDDDFKRIILDGDNIILEDTNDLAPGKYTLSVLPVSRIGSQLPKAATVKLTVKQGIDKIDIYATGQFIKKSGKPLTIKPAISYNNGDKTKTPAVKKVRWEITDADGNALTQASPLYGKVTINQKNGTVTVAKDLAIPKDPGSYSFVIVATAEDYEGNIASDTNPVELVSDQFPPVELEISIDDRIGDGHVKASDLKFSRGVTKGSDGKLYVDGDIWLFKINSERSSDIVACFVRIEGEEEGYGCGINNWGKGIHDLDSDVPIRAMKLGKRVLLTVQVISRAR